MFHLSREICNKQKMSTHNSKLVVWIQYHPSQQNQQSIAISCLCGGTKNIFESDMVQLHQPTRNKAI